MAETFAAIETIKQNCRRCYTCVRSCPVKAIKIENGQASVVPERCIACGRCTTVCSQNAKTYASGVELTLSILQGGAPAVALLAPSYVAEFDGVEPGRVVAALRAVGFKYVVEVARGADLVSAEYDKLLQEHPDGSWIATACPAIVERVRKYHPSLTGRLAPIVSPMVAAAVEARRIYGDGVRSVFIGPCIAKKLEVRDPLLPRVVDEALTFTELRRIVAGAGVDLGLLEPSEPDRPFAGIGRSFPLAGGLLITAGLESDPLETRFVVATGRGETDEVLEDMESGRIRPQLVEALMCHGCHAGPGMSRAASSLRMRADICAYAQQARGRRPEEAAVETVRALGRGYAVEDHRLKEPAEEDIRDILAHTNKFSADDELNCGACGYPTCRAKAAAVFNGLAEEAMCLPFLIDQAERVCNELHVPWRDMREIHRQLVSTEKLASLGQLAAGIAHELNNPLGTILLYSGLIERKLGKESKVSGDIDLVQKETQRCKRIVSGLLDFARQNRVRFVRTRMGEYVAKVLADSFNRRELEGRNVRLRFDGGGADVEADIDRDQMTQVLVNLVQNAIDALGEDGGEIAVSAGLSEGGDRVRISVEDDGCGIPDEDHDRVFQPFFTTKNIGRGTGLGLAIAYGIVKLHQGTIWFESKPGEGTTFYIEAPLQQARPMQSAGG
ncbi:MAG: 4Fe-4S binding protein [Acidobacteriota bacterium]|jgi:signal transduction histidine kinase/iron only hydrogenase large subunit-like protein|nr:4Fe-4S binding protein [Acidobacteriota bacterium]